MRVCEDGMVILHTVLSEDIKSVFSIPYHQLNLAVVEKTLTTFPSIHVSLFLIL